MVTSHVVQAGSDGCSEGSVIPLSIAVELK